ncbi:NUDIX hydrolase [[Clostridium] fimetarium]|nr:8-oxo-dGTP diphosphatase [[Clostridium] fimetarium]
MCFIIQKDSILLLNREKSKWMGSWNGIGGKFINEEETPMMCIKREVYEETGINIKHFNYKGIINRVEDNIQSGEIYVFTAELPENITYTTPRKTREGILDWKLISWILHPENTGVATNIPQFLPLLLESDEIYEHSCVYENNYLVECKSTKLSNQS